MDLVKGAEFFSNKKPPMHFHVAQDEYLQAVEGKTAVDIEGQELIFSPGDPEFTIKAWTNHRSYPIAPALQEPGCKTVKFLLSGAKSSKSFSLSPMFFENWYKYQDEIIKTSGRVSLIQVLSVSSLLLPGNFSGCVSN